MSKNESKRLGIVLSTVTDGPPQEFVEIGQLAEQHDFDSVYVNEGRGDAISCAQAIAAGTKNIIVGTNIANIYFRHAFLAASTTRTIAELSHGRFMLGLGMSHRGLLASLGIDMGDARETLENYSSAVRAGLRGELGQGFLQQVACKYRAPVYVAANTIESAAVAGRSGDGIMPFLSPVSYLPTLVNAAIEAAPANAEFGCVLSIPTFLSDDSDAARSAARYNLAFFSQLPNYRKQWRRAGFKTAMDAVQKLWRNGTRKEVAQQIPDELIDEVCVFGDREQCLRQLQAFRDAGADVPLLAVSPVNNDRLVATREAIVSLAPTK